MITGIYIIKNIINNKVYVGSAIDIKKRWRDHKWYLNHNKHHNSHLQSSWNKYGANAFEFSILLVCCVDELLEKETEYIHIHKSRDNAHGFNVNDPRQISLNRKTSSETKQILSFQKMGDKNPMYGRKGNLHPKYGIRMSNEKIKIVSEKMKKRKGSNANASKLSEIDVIEIRNLYSMRKNTQLELSKLFNITQATISDIVLRKSWTEI